MSHKIDKDKDNDRPGDRVASQRQARENAEAARDTRKSHQPGVDDDSEVVQSLVGTLGAPVEGAIDAIRERERRGQHGQDPGEIGHDRVAKQLFRSLAWKRNRLQDGRQGDRDR